MFVVTVQFEVKESRVDEFRPAVEAQARNSLAAEKDCHVFDVCYDPASVSTVFLYEVYSDADAFDRHLKTPHFHDFNATTADWIDSKAVRTWSRKELA